MNRVWLSVDWDFFMKEDPLWDWGHREVPFFFDDLWPIRTGQMKASGVDLIKETDPDRYDPKPLAFWSELARLGYIFKPKMFAVADTHASAAPFFLLSPKKVKDTRIVHFDAHHDCGYVALKELRRQQREGICDCASWQWHVLKSRPQLTTHLVYPTWRGTSEWFEDRIDQRLRSRMGVGVWSDEHVANGAGVVERVFVCRSSAWTHPVHDEKFRQMLAALTAMTGEEVSTLFSSGRDLINPMIPRPYNKMVEEQCSQQYGQILATMQAQRAAQEGRL